MSDEPVTPDPDNPDNPANPSDPDHPAVVQDEEGNVVDPNLIVVPPAVYPAQDGKGGTVYQTASGEPRTYEDWAAQNEAGGVVTSNEPGAPGAPEDAAAVEEAPAEENV